MGKKLPPFPKYHRQQLRAIRWRYFWSRITGREFNALDIIGRLSDRMGHSLDREQVLELAWQWYRPLSQCAVVEDGAHHLLRRLKEKGLTLGMVSNTFIPGQVLDRHIKEAGLLELLPVRVYSCDAGYRKPSPKIFQIALSQAGLAACENDVRRRQPACRYTGTNKAGLTSVLKGPSDRYADSDFRPRHTIRMLSELEPIVDGYLAG